MKHGEPVVLLHIRDALVLIQEYGDVGKAKFKKSTQVQDAILRRLEIVGEAVKRLPEAFRARHEQIPWKRVAGFRDVVIHHYNRVDLDEVWSIVEHDVPVLLQQVKALLARLGETR